MDTVYRRCAAVDVHLKSNEVCVRLAEEGENPERGASFGTTTRARTE
jgi:hypothetical protein